MSYLKGSDSAVTHHDASYCVHCGSGCRRRCACGHRRQSGHGAKHAVQQAKGFVDGCLVDRRVLDRQGAQEPVAWRKAGGSRQGRQDECNERRAGRGEPSSATDDADCFYSYGCRAGGAAWPNGGNRADWPTRTFRTGWTCRTDGTRWAGRLEGVGWIDRGRWACGRGREAGGRWARRRRRRCGDRRAGWCSGSTRFERADRSAGTRWCSGLDGRDRSYGRRWAGWASGFARLDRGDRSARPDW